MSSDEKIPARQSEQFDLLFEQLREGADGRKRTALEITKITSKHFGIVALFLLLVSVLLILDESLAFCATGMLSIFCALDWWNLREIKKEIEKWT